MSTFTTEKRLLSLYDLPISSPEVSLSPLDWLGVATFSLPAGTQLDLLWLSTFVSAGTGTGNPVINSNFVSGGIVTAYLIKDWVPDTEPWSQTPVVFLACANDGSVPQTLPAVSSLDGAAVKITAEGNYTLVLGNNTTNWTYTAGITGAVTIDTDP